MTASASPRRSAELVAPELAPYLDGGDTNTLLMPRCQGCGRLQWPPRPHCATCGAGSFAPTSIRATGALYSWTTTHAALAPEFAHLIPYTVVIVTLDVPERLRFIGRLQETNTVPELHIGARMSAAWDRDTHRTPLLLWKVDA